MRSGLDRIVSTKLSLALSLTDDFSGNQAVVGDVKIAISAMKLTAIENPSGYHIFLDLPNGTYTILAQSEYYLEEEQDLTAPDTHPVDLVLKPNPLYPFPLGTTLLRGVVTDTDANAVSGAVIEWISGPSETRSTATGEFVLYFPATQEDASIQIGVTKNPNPQKIVTAQVRKGKTSTIEITYP